jgi:predicted AlkP superfamily pyrophosphatase or phosphodiesterase
MKHFKGYLFGVFVALIIAGCAPRQERTPLLLISIDGFKPEYLEQHSPPNLMRLVKNGVLAKAMMPIFPSKTFPNHYAIVTGLYAEHSGVIANNMYDPAMDKWFALNKREAVTDSSWYGGEPIWVTAETQGVRTAPLFWPGSEAAMKGVRPTHWMPFNDDMHFESRIDSLIRWLASALETRPYFATLYFSDVDHYGHSYGPEDSTSIATAVARVDSGIGYLMKELEHAGILPNINILVVSDHGMAQLSDERVIFLDSMINMDDVQIIDWSPVAMISPKEGKAEAVYNALKKAESHYTLYKKEEIPDAYHLKNNARVPGLIMIADMGYSITTKDFFTKRGIGKGTHGYDNRSPEMQALFVAHGPSFKQGVLIEQFQNIHLYELMCKVLNLKPAPNDGHPDSLKHVLR